MRHVLCSGVIATLVIVAGGCGAISATSSTSPGERDGNAALAEFRQRVDNYMELREDVVDEVGDPVLTRDPALIRAREQALAERIRARRATAMHGDIFTPQVRAVFRRLLRPELKGEQGRDIDAKLNDDAPAPGAVPIEVNAKYPAGVPFPTTPAPILLALPTLPAGLEYRIIGNDLLLLDQPADVILDYIRNAVSTPGPTARGPSPSTHRRLLALGSGAAALFTTRYGC